MTKLLRASIRFWLQKDCRFWLIAETLSEHPPKIRPKHQENLSGSPQKIGPEPSKNSSETFKKIVRGPWKNRPESVKKSSETLKKFVRKPQQIRPKPSNNSFEPQIWLHPGGKGPQTTRFVGFFSFVGNHFSLAFPYPICAFIATFRDFGKNGKLGCHG